MIKIENLTKRYGNKYALSGISFEVNKGEIVGFLGPNGAGKSTTMNILTGFLSFTDGKVEINGLDILDYPDEAKKNIGYLPEQPPLYLDMTVSEYLNFIYDLKGCKLNRKKHIAEIIEVVRLTDVRGRLIGNLSKGYRQRVGIGQALVGNPQVIILDEPTVGLDPRQVVEIRNLIRTLGLDHTVILSTHILSEVQAVCDRVIIINKGKIVADRKTEDIASAVSGNRRMSVKICGPVKEVTSALRSLPGVLSAESVGNLDADSTSYVVESENGIDNFRFREKPIVLPDLYLDETNVYDMRLTKHEDGYIYGVFCSESKDTSVNDLSAAVAAAGIVRTKDLKHWERLDNLKTLRSPQQRNVVLHPEFVNGKYAFYTRPMDDFIETGSGGGIGFGLCDDITHAVIDEEKMTSLRKYHTITEAKNGAGATPIKTDKGWIHIAHGVRNTAAGLRYVIYAFATALDDPSKVIAEPSGMLIDRLTDYVFHTPADPGRSVECVAQRCELIAKNLEFLSKQ